MNENSFSRSNAYDVLNEIMDPELGLGFVDLGLIYELGYDDGAVHVLYSLTSAACPIADTVDFLIEEALLGIDGVSSVETELTFSPPWTPERISEDARFALGL